MQKMPETQVQSLGWEDPLEQQMPIHSSILPGEAHGRRSLVGYSPWGRKESDTTKYLSYIKGIRPFHEQHVELPQLNRFSFLAF